MQIKYIDTPKEQFVTRMKTGEMKYTRTTIHCPLCTSPFAKREFEDHVYKMHGTRADECFARLYGLPYPTRCASCGNPIHYVRHKGFPLTCANCTTGTVTGVEYKNADDAHKHVEQLTALLAQARSEEKRLAKEAELDRVPIEQLPFPSRKDPRFLQRVSKMMRTFFINGEKERGIELANLIDKVIAER